MEIWKIHVDLILTPTVLLHGNERSFSTAELLTNEATDLGSQRKFKIMSISILRCYPHLPALHINEDHGFVFLRPLIQTEQVDSFQIRDAAKYHELTFSHSNGIIQDIQWIAIDFQPSWAEYTNNLYFDPFSLSLRMMFSFFTHLPRATFNILNLSNAWHDESVLWRGSSSRKTRQKEKDWKGKATEKQGGQKRIEKQGRQKKTRKMKKEKKIEDDQQDSQVYSINHLEHLEGGGQTSHWQTLLTLARVLNSHFSLELIGSEKQRGWFFPLSMTPAYCSLSGEILYLVLWFAVNWSFLSATPSIQSDSSIQMKIPIVWSPPL